jgi:hypothetical protein
LWALSLLDFSEPIEQISERDSPTALLKLSSAYRLGAVHLKTFAYKHSPVEAIAYSGDFKSMISQLMGQEIYLRTTNSLPSLVPDLRAAAALAFPISKIPQVNRILAKFFIQGLRESDAGTLPTDVAISEDVA